jgi:hypothetical protein
MTAGFEATFFVLLFLEAAEEFAFSFTTRHSSVAQIHFFNAVLFKVIACSTTFLF